MTAAPGPPIGSRAADLEYRLVTEQTSRWLRPGDGQPTLVAFVDPTCPACEMVIEKIEEAVAERAERLRVLLLMSEPPAYIALSRAFSATTLALAQIVARDTIDRYRATATPLLVAFDGEGVVTQAETVGLGGSARVSEMVAACGRGAAAIEVLKVEA